MTDRLRGPGSNKSDLVYLDVEALKIRRNQKRLLWSFAVLTTLVIFCTASVIWLMQEVVDDDSNNLEPNSVRLLSEASSDGAVQSLFAGMGYWTIKEPLPFARSDHHVIAVDDYLYIIGGLNGNDSVVDDVTIYDTVLGTYAPGPPLPIALHRFAAAYDDINREIYVFGGIDETDGDAVESVFVLDIDREEWRAGPDLNSPRSDLCGAFVDGHVYAVGGYSLGYTETLDTVEALDLSTGEWNPVASMLTPRGDCKAAQLDGKLIVLGGYYDSTGQWSPDAFRDEVELYSPDVGEWKELARMRNARGDKSIAVLKNNRVLVIGGETHNRGLHTKVAIHHVEEYVMSQDIWIDRAPLPEATFRAGAAYVDGIVFVFGGHRTCDAQGNESDTDVCTESDVVQAYFDFEHPNIFIV